MNSKVKALNLLGLAMRAQKLESGQPIVLSAIRNRTAKTVIVASDASENTKKQIMNKSNYYEIPVYNLFTKYELSNAIGKERTVCAIIDKGFAQSFQKLQ